MSNLINNFSRMIVEMDQMKVIFVQKKRVPTSSLLVLALVTVFLNHGFVMAMTIASVRLEFTKIGKVIINLNFK